VASSWFSTERPAAAGVLAAAVLAVCGSGCGSFYLLRDPVMTGGEAAIAPPSSRARTTGSLWRDQVSANYMFTDARARFPGDLLTIVIAETASGSKEADTSTSTKTNVLLSIAEFFGFPQALAANNPDINPTQLIQANSEMQWDGEGSTARAGQLNARITVQVTTVAPNGNLWVEGEKVVAVNEEDQHIAVSGWVRPEDITTQNEVLSTRLASANIEYYGTGTVGRQQRSGWAVTILDYVWPF
jgi:flagellar L-ring protein precursor FlgH